MLYLLTGDIQTGKTRWLQALIAEFEEHGVTPYGVVAPGQWLEHCTDGVTTFEKTGIDNELLPQHKLIPFARRATDVNGEEARRTCSQAQKAQLGWAIDDSALARVNEHLAWVARITADNAESNESEMTGRKALLVIDELGKLEMLHGKGLVNGLALVERGATAALPHALLIVREQLLGQAKARFSNAPWGGIQTIRPTREAHGELLASIDHLPLG